MTLVTLIITTLGNGVGLLLEMVALLLVVRAICGWRSVPILAEFDAAGRPLVDRTLNCVTGLWRRLVPTRPLTPNRSLLAAWLSVTALRWCVALFMTVAVQVK